MRQITIRGLPSDLSRRIEELARAEGISLNKAAVKLLLRGTGLAVEGDETPGAIGRTLDWFIGSGTEEDHQAVLRAVAESDAADLEARERLGEP